ncbi:Scr1 family TA system antitoxin-like transcriptional regulator [Micromonospora sp. NBC_01412]|uniref:Scr1 family TA system antitoxin-like transcriptional regulator n=1 Tax=Micromonospora sp. NBC_01412 TaxID=2903590 RepID=UPI00324886EA
MLAHHRSRAPGSSRSGEPAGEVERIVASRLGRQEILERERPPQFIAVVDDSVLRRPVLDQPGLMAEQLDHLAGQAMREHIQVHVVPVDAGTRQSRYNSSRA